MNRLASNWHGINPASLNRQQRQEYRADATKDLREHGVKGYRRPLPMPDHEPDVYGVTAVLPTRRSKEQRGADWRARHNLVAVPRPKPSCVGLRRGRDNTGRLEFAQQKRDRKLAARMLVKVTV